MNKWLIAVIVVGGLAFGWYVLRQQRYTPPWEMPKTGQVTRGDIRVPITAAGLIHANQVIDIKSKASGEIIEIPVVEGSYVKKGDVLVVLKKDDEQRSLDQRRAELQRAEALLTSARVAYERSDATIAQAKAQFDELVAQGAIVRFELEKVERLAREGRRELYSEQQVNDARAQVQMNAARQAAAQANICLLYTSDAADVYSV